MTDRADIRWLKYDELYPDLQTGWIVLFSGREQSNFGCDISSCIRDFTLSNWSHIGMVVRTDRGPYDYARPMLWESNLGKGHVPDLLTGHVKSGARLVPLRERLQAYTEEQIAFRPLRINVESRAERERIRDNMNRMLVDEGFLVKHASINYDLHWAHFLDGLVENATHLRKNPLPPNRRQLDKSKFCSALVQYTYRHLGVTSPDVPGREDFDVLPTHFAIEEHPSFLLHFNEPFSLGGQYYLLKE